MFPDRRAGADLAIDLGTSNTRVVARGRGIVLEEPTVLALQAGPRGRQVRAFGAEAKKMLGRAPDRTRVVQPLREGVVADFEATELFLREVLGAVGSRGLLRPRVLVCIATGASEVERRAVQESARAAGAREVTLVPTPLAAAVGVDLPIADPAGSLVVDVGGGRADAAIISLGGMVVHRSVTAAGDAVEEAIRGWLRTEHGLLVGERTSETIKLRIGSAAPLERPARMRVRGRDLATGQPRELDLDSNQVAEALSGWVETLRRSLLDVLRDTPPELSADVLDRGLILCGGGALLRETDAVLREASGLPVLHAEQPLRSVVLGAGRLLDDAELFARVTAAT